MVVLYAYGVPPLMLTFTPGWLSGTSKQDTEDDGAPSGASPQPLRRQPDVRDLQPHRGLHPSNPRRPQDRWNRSALQLVHPHLSETVHVKLAAPEVAAQGELRMIPCLPRGRSGHFAHNRDRSSAFLAANSSGDRMPFCSKSASRSILPKMSDS
jgi:hypothetical protein